MQRAQKTKDQKLSNKHNELRSDVDYYYCYWKLSQAAKIKTNTCDMIYCLD